MLTFTKFRRAKGLDLTPINGKWLSGSLIEFIQNYKMKNFPFGGNHIKETDGFCAAMPYVALNSGNGEVHLKVPEIVKTLSTWPTSVSHGRVAAKILEKFILCGKDTRNVYKNLLSSLTSCVISCRPRTCAERNEGNRKRIS